MHSVRSLGTVGQAALCAAYVVFGLAMGLQQTESGGEMLFVVAGIALLVGIIVAGIAWIKTGPVLGPLGKAAGITLLAAPVAGLLFFGVIPGDREWGKMGAMVTGINVTGLVAIASGVLAGSAMLAALSRLPAGPTWAAGIGHLVSAAISLVAIALSFGGKVTVAPFIASGVGVLWAHGAAVWFFRKLPDA